MHDNMWKFFRKQLEGVLKVSSPIGRSVWSNLLVLVFNCIASVYFFSPIKKLLDGGTICRADLRNFKPGIDCVNMQESPMIAVLTVVVAGLLSLVCAVCAMRECIHLCSRIHRWLENMGNKN